MKTNCIIVDDEPIAVEVIESHLSHFNDIHIVAKCNNAIEAFEIIKNNHIDLIFLDIQMPEINGIDFLKSIDQNFEVIITTAFRDYAIEGFQMNVLDYLLKPVSLERMMKAMDKYYQSKADELIQFKNEAGININRFIYIKEGKETHKVYLKDILYIESFREYIQIHLKDRDLKVRYKISQIEKNLPQNSFLRIHKSYIISISKITSFSNYFIKVNQKQLPIGKTYIEQVKKCLQ